VAQLSKYMSLSTNIFQGSAMLELNSCNSHTNFSARRQWQNSAKLWRLR